MVEDRRGRGQLLMIQKCCVYYEFYRFFLFDYSRFVGHIRPSELQGTIT